MNSFGGWNPGDYIPPEMRRLPVSSKDNPVTGRRSYYIEPALLPALRDDQYERIYHSALLKARFDPVIKASEKKYYRMLAAAAKKRMSLSGRLPIMMSNAQYGQARRMIHDINGSTYGYLYSPKNKKERMQRWNALYHLPYDRDPAEAVIHGFHPAALDMDKVKPLMALPKDVAARYANEAAYKAYLEDRRVEMAKVRDRHLRNRAKQLQALAADPNFSIDEYNAMRKLPYHGIYQQAVDTGSDYYVPKEKWGDMPQQLLTYASP